MGHRQDPSSGALRVSEREPAAPLEAPDPARAFADAMLTTGEPTTATYAQRGDILTADDVAAWLEVNRKTVYDAAGRKEMPCARLGRRFIFSRAAIAAWLAGGRA